MSREKRALRSRAIDSQALAEETRRIEGGFGNALRRRHVPTGIAGLDALLPGGGVAADYLSPRRAAAPRT